MGVVDSEQAAFQLTLIIAQRVRKLLLTKTHRHVYGQKDAKLAVSTLVCTSFFSLSSAGTRGTLFVEYLRRECRGFDRQERAFRHSSGHPQLEVQEELPIVVRSKIAAIDGMANFSSLPVVQRTHRLSLPSPCLCQLVRPSSRIPDSSRCADIPKLYSRSTTRPIFLTLPMGYTARASVFSDRAARLRKSARLVFLSSEFHLAMEVCGTLIRRITLQGRCGHHQGTGDAWRKGEDAASCRSRRSVHSNPYSGPCGGTCSTPRTGVTHSVPR